MIREVFQGDEHNVPRMVSKRRRGSESDVPLIPAKKARTACDRWRIGRASPKSHQKVYRVHIPRVETPSNRVIVIFMFYKQLRVIFSQKQVIGIAFGLLCIFSIFPAWRFWRAHFSSPACIIIAPAPDGAWLGISKAERIGLLELIKDHLEANKGTNVLGPENLIAHADIHFRHVIIGGARKGQELELSMEDRPSGKKRNIALSAPKTVLASALSHLGTGLRAELVPQRPEDFWLLASATGCALDGAPCPIGSLEILRQTEPRCASAHATHAILALRELLRQTDNSNLGTHQRCQNAFQLALKLVPHYPRALRHYAHFKTCIGQQEDALLALSKGIKAHPQLANLRGALAFPAATTGLLEGARASLEKRDKMLPFCRFPGDPSENTWLYIKDYARFEASIRTDNRWMDSGADFYRGYVALLKGNQSDALNFFRNSRKGKSAPPFERLSEIYTLHLTGDRAQALVLLQALQKERLRLRSLDGQFTFRIAEAFGYLGSQEEALETVLAAFAQGFSCANWYEESPFLSKLPRNARWQSLQQHLEERQNYMHRIFPVQQFAR